MARIGSAGSPDLSQWRQGSVMQQVASRLTMPQRGRITSLGCWIRGVSGYGSISYRLVLWDWGGTVDSSNGVLGQTAQQSASAAAFALSSLVKVTWPLESPVDLPAGKNFMVGLSSDTASGTACQFGVDNVGTKYVKDLGTGAAWPVPMKGSYSQTYDLAAWVENYDAVGSAYVYRSGAWVQAASVQVRRSGAWVDAESVQVRRSGAWTDAG